jgi:transposase-like protein
MSDDDNDGTPNTPLLLNPTFKRRRFTKQEKLGLVRSICRKIQVNNVSVRQACADVNIHHKQYLSWKREYSSIENAQNPKAKCRSAGHDSIRKPIEQYLLRYIFELREQGIGVKIVMVMRRAASVSRVFRDKSPCAQYNTSETFYQESRPVYRMSTHESQWDLAVVAAESLDFILNVRPKLIQPCRHHDYILNMYQTPIPFTYHSNRT